jgi:hypothetical protein|tara:strand:+ start:3566 stop:4369 length:804 start_codon:yes stop_codon:yes gene_type:complete
MKIFNNYTFLCSIIFFIFVPLKTNASLSISPAFLHIDLSKTNPSGTFTVTNLSNIDQTYRARSMHFEISTSGSIVPIEPDEFSLAKAIKFNPKEFTLPAKSKRKIRFTIINRNLRDAKEYWGAIEFTPLKTFSMKAQDREGHSMNVTVISRILVPIYGMGKEVEFKGTVASLMGVKINDAVSLTGQVSNEGDGVLRLSGGWSIYQKGMKELLYSVPVKKFVVLPQSKRNIKALLDNKLNHGEYDIILDLTEQRSDERVMNRGVFSIE